MGLCLPWGPRFFFSHSDGAVAQFNTPVLCEIPSQPAADISVKFGLDCQVQVNLKNSYVAPQAELQVRETWSLHSARGWLKLVSTHVTLPLTCECAEGYCGD